MKIAGVYSFNDGEKAVKTNYLDLLAEVTSAGINMAREING